MTGRVCRTIPLSTLAACLLFVLSGPVMSAKDCTCGRCTKTDCKASGCHHVCMCVTSDPKNPVPCACNHEVFTGASCKWDAQCGEKSVKCTCLKDSAQCTKCSSYCPQAPKPCSASNCGNLFYVWSEGLQSEVPHNCSCYYCGDCDCTTCYCMASPFFPHQRCGTCKEPGGTKQGPDCYDAKRVACNTGPACKCDSSNPCGNIKCAAPGCATSRCGSSAKCNGTGCTCNQNCCHCGGMQQHVCSPPNPNCACNMCPETPIARPCGANNWADCAEHHCGPH